MCLCYILSLTKAISHNRFIQNGQKSEMCGSRDASSSTQTSWPCECPYKHSKTVIYSILQDSLWMSNQQRPNSHPLKQTQSLWSRLSCLWLCACLCLFICHLSSVFSLFLTLPNPTKMCFFLNPFYFSLTHPLIPCSLFLCTFNIFFILHLCSYLCKKSLIPPFLRLIDKSPSSVPNSCDRDCFLYVHSAEAS